MKSPAVALLLLPYPLGHLISLSSQDVNLETTRFETRYVVSGRRSIDLRARRRHNTFTFMLSVVAGLCTIIVAFGAARTLAGYRGTKGKHRGE